MYKVIKRFFDILFSAICILTMGPILIPVLIGLKLTGEGYIFYKQERVGFNNQNFYILKFATMLKDSPNMPGGYLTTLKDPRITPMGGFLRKSKINELPQLFNILLGDMSFVGPRPVMPESFEAYPKDVQKIICKNKPGLSGIGSIVFRDEESIITNKKNQGYEVALFYSDKIYPFKGKLEMWYYHNHSFYVDLKIIIATIFVVLRPNLDVMEIFFPEIPKRDF
jgi:lipopolysaccharide/colanic/teichoic acid biosynthesis glycosyltransferase